MISFSRLLTISYLVIVLLGIALAAPLAWLSLEQAYLDNQQANMLAQARLVAQALQSTVQPLPAAPYSPASNATNALPGIHTRIIDAPDAASAPTPKQPGVGVYTTLIAEDGPVVIGLEAAPPVLQQAQQAQQIQQTQPAQQTQQIVAPLPSLTQNATGSVSPQELLSRPEIAAAFSGRPATAIRTIFEGQRVLYAAAPIVSAGGGVTRIVYIATPLPQSGWAALAPATRWQLLGLAVLVVCLTGLLGWRFSCVLAHALAQIVAAAKRVAAGDLGSHLPTQAAVAELRVLNQAFNEMTESLRQADHVKMAFVADVSHELRTPLTVIKGTVETLQDGALDDLDARDQFLASIAHETERLIDLVSGLLTLARADGGALKIQPTPLNLAVLAQARVTHMQATAARKAIDAHVRVTGDSCWVLADTYRITQVLDNLLDNAVRYSRRGDHVQIVITPGTAQVTCSVVDTGPGIAAAHLPLLFNRFYRVEASRNRSLGGSGLGLAICRAIVEAHSGSISVQSIEGQGSTFTFTLPAAQNCS